MKVKRREFLINSALSAVSLAGARLAQGADNRAGAQQSTPDVATAPGRPVRVASIGFPVRAPLPLDTIRLRVGEEASRGVDVVLLPETCEGQNGSSQEPLHGPTVTAMAELARKHRTYIAVPIDRRTGNERWNTTVFLDRTGNVVHTYDKVFPYWSEFDLTPAVSPGRAADVYEADFGKVGFACCFDANFPEVWKSLADKGAELVLWPSAYSAGMSLQAHAINHHYYIVTATQVPDCIVYDITGERILRQNAKGINASRVTLDLDRGIYHQNFNISGRDKLLREHAADVEQEKWLELEQWFVLRAKRPGVSARALAHQYGLEELRHYVERSRVEIDKRRGFRFGKRIA